MTHHATAALHCSAKNRNVRAHHSKRRHAEEAGCYAGIAFRLRDDRLPFPALQQLASLVEQRGYETLFTPEGGGRDVFITLAAFASATQRIRLSPGIASVFTRTPGVLTAAAVTLDQLSDDRAILGLGTGHAESLESGHGLAFERPLARVRDTVLLVKAACAVPAYRTHPPSISAECD